MGFEIPEMRFFLIKKKIYDNNSGVSTVHMCWLESLAISNPDPC